MAFIPPPQYGKTTKYEFSRLKQFGDSMFVECKKISGVRDAAHKFAKYNGFKVATRVEEGGVRIYHAGITENQNG